jgi:hypothetical protein
MTHEDENAARGPSEVDIAAQAKVWEESFFEVARLRGRAPGGKKRFRPRSPPHEDFLTASEADKAIKRIANIVHCATLNPPVGIRACLRGAILRAAPEDIKKIAATAEFLGQLMSDAKAAAAHAHPETPRNDR